VDTCCGVPKCIPDDGCANENNPIFSDPLPPGAKTAAGVVGPDGLVLSGGDGGIAGVSESCCSLADLSYLGTLYKAADDSCFCGAGSPRFSILADEDGDGEADCSIFVSLEPNPPNQFCPPPGWHDTGNLVNHPTAWTTGSNCDGAVTFGSHAQVLAALGDVTIVGIVLVADPSCTEPHTFYFDDWQIVCGGKATLIDFDDDIIATGGGPTCNVVSLECTRSDGEPLNAPYPEGETEVCCVATDDCGETVECCYTVTVVATDEVEVCIELPASVADTRCIRLSTYDAGCNEIDCQELSVTFTDHDANPATPVRGTATYSIACPSDAVAVCAKDEQHTLSDMVSVDDLDNDGVFEASECLLLRAGDTDDNDEIDINDVTFTFSEFGQSDPPIVCDPDCEDDIFPASTLRGADFNNDGTVNFLDPSALNPNFGFNGTCTCAGPMPAQSVKTEVDALDLAPAVAAKVDVDRNGVVNFLDIRLLELRHGLDHSLSTTIENIDKLQKSQQSH
jgi:hypothetical protein